LSAFVQNTPILALDELQWQLAMRTKWSLGVPHVTSLKGNLNRENSFSKVLPRGNREDRKLITVMKVFICNITQRKTNLLTNYFQKQLANLLVSATCYFKQEHCKQQFDCFLKSIVMV